MYRPLILLIKVIYHYGYLAAPETQLASEYPTEDIKHPIVPGILY